MSALHRIRREIRPDRLAQGGRQQRYPPLAGGGERQPLVAPFEILRQTETRSVEEAEPVLRLLVSAFGGKPHVLRRLLDVMPDRVGLLVPSAELEQRLRITAARGLAERVQFHSGHPARERRHDRNGQNSPPDQPNCPNRWRLMDQTAIGPHDGALTRDVCSHPCDQRLGSVPKLRNDGVDRVA